MNTVKMANKLITARGDKTQQEVAEALRISQAALAMYENGKRIPRDEIKLKLARYYGTTVESLFFAR